MSGILKLGATGGQILFSTSGTAGFAGTAGYGSLYYGTDKQLRLKDDVGTITILGAGGTNGTSGSSGTSGANGAGLSTKNIEISAADFTFSSPDSTATITFAQPFGSTDYSVDVIWKNTNSGNWFSLSGTVGVRINNKTAAGFDLVYASFDVPTTIPGYVAYITAIALGETAVPGTSGTSGNSGSSGTSGSSGVGLAMKSGGNVGTSGWASLGSNEYEYEITFSTAFPNTNYSPNARMPIIGAGTSGVAYTPLIRDSSLLASGFKVTVFSASALDTNVDLRWTAIAWGEI